jgi:hypothetical protein
MGMPSNYATIYNVMGFFTAQGLQIVIGGLRAILIVSIIIEHYISQVQDSS